MLHLTDGARSFLKFIAHSAPPAGERCVSHQRPPMNRPKLSAKQFYRVACQAFGEVLEPAGFTSAASKVCTFYRQHGAEIWHFVRPVRSFRLPQYDLWVFPHSPRIETQFQEQFPDELSPPTDVWCNLHSTQGVGLSQEWYWCRTAEGMLRDFAERVKPALLNHALPYLDRICTCDDLLPLIRSWYYRQQAGLPNE